MKTDISWTYESWLNQIRIFVLSMIIDSISANLFFIAKIVSGFRYVSHHVEYHNCFHYANNWLQSFWFMFGRKMKKLVTKIIFLQRVIFEIFCVDLEWQ